MENHTIEFWARIIFSIIITIPLLIIFVDSIATKIFGIGYMFVMIFNNSTEIK